MSGSAMCLFLEKKKKKKKHIFKNFLEVKTEMDSWSLAASLFLGLIACVSENKKFPS